MPTPYVPVTWLVQFTGDNLDEITAAFAPQANTFGEGLGRVRIVGNQAVLDWPTFPDGGIVVANVGDYVDQNGMPQPKAWIETNFRPLSSLADLG